MSHYPPFVGVDDCEEGYSVPLVEELGGWENGGKLEELTPLELEEGEEVDTES